MATLKARPRHRSLDSLSSPFTAVFTSVGVQQNEKALKLAFYNTAALVFVTLSGCAAVAVYYVLEPFLRPLLWASLCGAFLYPFKWKLTQVVRGFLRSLRETNTPLVVGAVVLPFHLANKSSDFVGSLIVQKIRILFTSSLIAVGVYVLYIIQPFNEIVWILKGSGLVVHLLLDFFYNPYLVSILGLVHTSHLCRVEFNSIKCDRNATVYSCVILVLNLIQNLYCQVCLSAENVLKVEYSIW